jgi:hypothetical protein
MTQDEIIKVFKKYSKSVDTEYNVYNCLIEEDWFPIAKELVGLFCQPPVIKSVCDVCQSIDDVQSYCRKCMDERC